MKSIWHRSCARQQVMKTLTQNTLHGILLLTVVTVLTSFGIARADDIVVRHHDAWSHDDKGYWDDHEHYQAFVIHEHHHGFWKVDNGARVFINID